MHAASAQIGIAIANRLPNIQLTATPAARPWPSGSCSPRARVFGASGAGRDGAHFRRRHTAAQERAAKAAYVQASEQYRSTVLTAFQNVADTLTALQQDAEGLKASAAADAAKTTLDLSQRQWQTGYANYLGC
jgi:outer membrane protein TolC